MYSNQVTGGGALKRGGPLAVAIGVHLALAYVLAISMGVVEVPKIIEPVEAIFIPEPTQPEPEIPLVKPEIADIAPPIEPPPDIQFDEPVIPLVENPMPASDNAIAATESAGPISQARELKTSTHVEPTYPPQSRRAGEEGTVRLRVLVDETGRPKDVQIAQTSGFSRLDDAAKQAVRRWRFVAATDGAKPISVWTQVAIVFRLTDAR